MNLPDPAGPSVFDAYLARWKLVPDGSPVVTHAARLLPVRHEGRPAMLKVSHEEDEKQGGVLMRWWDGHGAARALLDSQRDMAVLHGDAHHDNILDFGERGWLVIDPKRLYGERAFDYANIFCNPDLADPVPPAAIVPGRFERRLDIVAAQAGLDRRRLLQWVLAWCGLSAAWYLDDGDDAAIDLDIAAQARALLGR